MRNILCAIIVLTLIGLTADSTGAADASGGQAGAGLRIPVGARPSGMGNSFTAVADDANALYFNPAGLGQIERGSLSAMMSLMSLDRSRHLGAGAITVPNVASFGAMFSGYTVSDIDGRDMMGAETGTFDDNEWSLTVGAARNIAPPLAIGASVKYLSHSLAGYGATGIGFDAGVLGVFEVDVGIPLERIRLGASFCDLGSKLEWDTPSSHEDEIPATIRGGTSFDLVFENFDVLLAGDVSKTDKEDARIHLGSELWMLNALGMRFGIDHNELTLGASFKMHQLQVAYAYMQDALEEGATSRIGVQFDF